MALLIDVITYIVRLLLNAVSIGFLWEIAVREQMGTEHLPYGTSMWIALGLSLLAREYETLASSGNDKHEKIGLSVLNNLVIPIFTFIVLGIMYLTK